MKFLDKLKKFERWQLIAFLSFFIGLLTVLPISIKFYSGSFVTLEGHHDFLKIAVEVLTAFFVWYLNSFLLLSLGRIGLVIWVLFLFSSLSVSYFFVTFGKNIDAWVAGDILENINGLTSEYLSFTLVLTIVIAAGFFAFLAWAIQRQKNSFRSRGFLIAHLIVLIELLSVIFGNEFIMKKVRRNYPPLSIFSSVSKYVKIIKESEIQIQKSQSLKIINQHQIGYEPNKEGKLIVFIVGESLRNDYFYDMLPQFSSKLKNQKNITFFKDVHACENVTKKSIPCLLTDVDHKNWENFMGSVNIIDIFHKLNFGTYWIDNQSLYGYFDSTYSFLAKSSDLVIEEKYINLDLGRYNNYDENLLPYIKKAILEQKKSKKDKFIFIHLLGSHWHLELRYPKEYAIFSPHCSIERTASSCSKEELKNSYKNSVIYSFKVLEEMIDLFSNQNAFVVFTPDHGISLGEGGKIGNAADEKPIEQISVPLFVWYSDEFKKENSQLVNNLSKNSHKKISHEHAFHSLLGCAGVKTDLIKEDLNLCASSKGNGARNSKRH